MKCSRLFVAVAVLILFVLVFVGREMYTQSELREKLKQYESDFGPANFEILLKYADDKKARKELDFSQGDYAKLLQVFQLFPDEKRENINSIIKLHSLT